MKKQMGNRGGDKQHVSIINLTIKTLVPKDDVRDVIAPGIVTFHSFHKATNNGQVSYRLDSLFSIVLGVYLFERQTRSFSACFFWHRKNHIKAMPSSSLSHF